MCVTLSLATRLVNNEKRFLGGNPSFVCLFVFVCVILFVFVCVIFFLLLIHASKLTRENALSCF